MAGSVKHNSDFTNIPNDICRLLPESYEELKNFHQVQDTLSYTQEQLCGYFHKYFPRSYTETFDIISRLFKSSEKYSSIFSAKRHLTLLDIGSGIGGNMVGMLKYISKKFPGVQSVEIHSFDGNERALNFQASIIENIGLNFTVTFNPVPHVFSPETLIEELENLVCSGLSYDIVMSSKFINELYRKKPGIKGLYSRFLVFGSDVLNREGILMVTELTDRLTGNVFFNQVFNRETSSYYNACTDPLKQLFPIQCHLWRDCCEDANTCFIQQRFLSDKSKIFTQIFCQASLGRQFYNKQFLHELKSAPIQIKQTGCHGGYFCYQGRLRDTGQLS